MDRTLRRFEMRIGEQISNIGSEVHRAIRYKNRNDEVKKVHFYQKAKELLELTCDDSKNQHRCGELRFCIEELTDYFIGTNQYNTTDEALIKYYDAFWYYKVNKDDLMYQMCNKNGDNQHDYS